MKKNDFRSSPVASRTCTREALQRAGFRLQTQARKRRWQCQNLARALKGYRWRGSDCPFADSALISQLEVDLGDASRQLKFETEWSGETERKVLAGTVALFCWGGVLRGKGHNPPCLEDIKAVMRTATEREDRFKAPLDSAWTKLAAISTAWLANDGEQHPQIIYDSRVSVSLLRAIDAVCAQDASLHIARDQLKARGLGYVIGRGR